MNVNRLFDGESLDFRNNHLSGTPPVPQIYEVPPGPTVTLAEIIDIDGERKLGLV